MSVGSCCELRVSELTGDGQIFNLVLDGFQPESWSPGQFVMIRPESWTSDPLWPRPFSIAQAGNGQLRLIIQIVGSGTELISRLRPGERVTAWGPLGQGFCFTPDERLLLLAGGIGLAPFVGLCANHRHPDGLELFFGHRLPLEAYPFDEIASRVKATHHHQPDQAALTEFVAMLEAKIADNARTTILACGPTPFLKAVQNFARVHGANAQISLENRMACGVGACLGCACKTVRGEYVQVCSKGPVFRAEDIDL